MTAGPGVVMGRFDRWHAVVLRLRGIGWFTWTVRVLLAVGFVPPGLQKLVVDRPFMLGDPATDNAVYFFDALYRAGWLYEFVGLAQVVAAVLLLIPRLSVVGALAYFPLILGIEVITTTMDFHGTWVITSLMLLGVVYLLCADWPRLRPLFAARNPNAVR